MGNMELLEKIDLKKSDPKGMLCHIEGFPKLCEDAFRAADNFSLPSFYIKAKKIVLLGMGGSGQAGDIVKGLLSRTNLIVESVHDYNLPSYVDSDTLVIASSYSGNTEETLAGFIEAFKKGAKLAAITTGGKLAILAEKYKAPLLRFDYDSPPRAAFPYLFISLIAIFVRLGYLELGSEEIGTTLNTLKEANKKYQSTVSSFQNPAKILAQKIHGRIPVIYSSAKLSGVAARIKAAFNENAKNFSFNEELPELDHKSLEGLANPKDTVYVLMIESNFEYERNLLRENLTSEILIKRHIPVERVKFIQAKNPLAETLLQVMFGDYVSYYLAILNKANPGTNDIVDYLKSRLT